jgi:AbiU2
MTVSVIYSTEALLPKNNGQPGRQSELHSFASLEEAKSAPIPEGYVFAAIQTESGYHTYSKMLGWVFHDDTERCPGSGGPSLASSRLNLRVPESKKRRRGTNTMGIDDPKIVALREMVTAAQQGFDLAVTFHEVWKPAAYDQDLHSRLGESFATRAFLVTRAALRREMLLALIRLWDTNPKSVRMGCIAATLRDREVIDALVLDRVRHLGVPDAMGAMRDEFGKKVDELFQLLNRYMEGGERHAVLETLRALRNERLAHRQLAPAAVPRASATDEEIEEFYQDNSKLIHTLLSLVNATAYEPADTAKVYTFYASHFWGAFQRTGNGSR